MKFWDKLWGKKNISGQPVGEVEAGQEIQTGKQETTVSSDADNSSDLIRIILELESGSYTANRFDMDFKREADTGGEYSGGLICLELDGIHADPVLCEWVAGTRLCRSGEVRVCRKTEEGYKTVLFSVVFKDACCIHYHEQCHPEVPDRKTKVKIAPRYLKIGHEEYENKWKN